MRGRVLAAAALLTASATALAGCSSSSSDSSADSSGRPRLAVEGAYVPQPPLADMAAGYFTVRNSGTAADRLTSVSSPAVSDVSLMVTGADGTMHDVTGLPVPAGGRLVLRLGGDHLMLMGLKGRPAIGRRLALRLHFDRSAPITVSARVEPATYRPKG